MCMVLKNRFPKRGRIAEERIRVWKVLVRSPYCESLFITPFAHNCVRTGTVVRPNESKVCIVDRKIYWGAIHTWLDTEKGLRRALKMAGQHFDIVGTKVVAECVIPEGTRYWLEDKDNICAERIDVVDIACETFESAGVTERNLGVKRAYPYENEWLERTLAEIKNRKRKK